MGAWAKIDMEGSRIAVRIDETKKELVKNFSQHIQNSTLEILERLEIEFAGLDQKQAKELNILYLSKIKRMAD